MTACIVELCLLNSYLMRAGVRYCLGTLPKLTLISLFCVCFSRMSSPMWVAITKAIAEVRRVGVGQRTTMARRSRMLIRQTSSKGLLIRRIQLSFTLANSIDSPSPPSATVLGHMQAPEEASMVRRSSSNTLKYMLRMNVHRMAHWKKGALFLYCESTARLPKVQKVMIAYMYLTVWLIEVVECALNLYAWMTVLILRQVVYGPKAVLGMLGLLIESCCLISVRAMHYFLRKRRIWASLRTTRKSIREANMQKMTLQLSELAFLLGQRKVSSLMKMRKKMTMRTTATTSEVLTKELNLATLASINPIFYMFQAVVLVFGSSSCYSLNICMQIMQRCRERM